MKTCALLCVGLALLPLTARGDEKPAAASAKVKEKLGERAVAVLTGATRVEVFRVTADRDKKPDEPGVGGFAVTATAKEKDPAFAARLAAVLLDEKAYSNPRVLKCFDPGVAYRVWKDKESVEVLVCFKCRNLRVITRDAEGKEVRRATGSFEDAVFAPLAKLAKETFPDDKEIEELQGPGEKK